MSSELIRSKDLACRSSEIHIMKTNHYIPSINPVQLLAVHANDSRLDETNQISVFSLTIPLTLIAARSLIARATFYNFLHRTDRE